MSNRFVLIIKSGAKSEPLAAIRYRWAGFTVNALRVIQGVCDDIPKTLARQHRSVKREHLIHLADINCYGCSDPWYTCPGVDTLQESGDPWISFSLSTIENFIEGADITATLDLYHRTINVEDCFIRRPLDPRHITDQTLELDPTQDISIDELAHFIRDVETHNLIANGLYEYHYVS